MSRPIEASGFNADLTTNAEEEYVEVRSLFDPKQVIQDLNDYFEVWENKIIGKAMRSGMEGGASELAARLFLLWNESPQVVITPELIQRELDKLIEEIKGKK